ncbi:HlyD family efflux transporter periplasmic adaptor subunit [Ornithinibacillus gellani]|uniref:efflux RND transporter periplasmic adaptor subunit n=1 Tax=Ornithinibacillus gellani TaxID=2293253 RepID=UPI000F477E21|nr:HlyD family efflux transporter periplasmic adaptor subunit [Ornithinibacillus gellani]TQS76170.1 HlyD family efflux transporter periplasmic adaptor subunit [Ornithinibacillus gellani]
MRWGRIIIAAIILFIGLNILLIVIDQDDKISRLSHVKDWTAVYEQDLYEYLDTRGVITFSNEENIYFDKNVGSFHEFLVEAGDVVQAGDPLYSYKATNYYETLARLDSEKGRVQEEISAIESAIQTMSAYMIQQPGDIVLELEEERLEVPQNVAEAELIKEQFITEKQKELGQKQAELNSLESQLSELNGSGDTITVESAYEGLITEVSKSLADPVLTIQGTELHVESELDEKKRLELEQIETDEGLAVKVVLDANKQELNGTVTHLAEMPSRESSVSSMYPMEISFDEEEEGEELDQLLPGLHADLSIVLRESLKATTIDRSALFGNEIWKMNAQGKLMLTGVETGIQKEKMTEITKGVSLGERLATKESEQFRDGAVFITPLKWEHFSWKQTVDNKLGNWKKGFVIGLLSR